MKVLYEVEERAYAGNAIRLVYYEDSKMYGVESRPILLDPAHQEEEPWGTMGGSVGYNESAFETYAEVMAFLGKGLGEEEKNPEVWLEMLECQ